MMRELEVNKGQTRFIQFVTVNQRGAIAAFPEGARPAIDSIHILNIPPAQ